MGGATASADLFTVALPALWSPVALGHAATSTSVMIHCAHEPSSLPGHPTYDERPLVSGPLVTAGVQGFEPQLTEPESVVLPVTPYPNGPSRNRVTTLPELSHLPKTTYSVRGKQDHRTRPDAVGIGPRAAEF